MAPNNASSNYESYPEFTVSFPAEYVAIVSINRPNKLNAFTPSMFHQLGAVFNHLSFDPSIRAIVLTGTGPRAFTAGLDVSAAASGPILTGAPKESTGPDPARVAAGLRRHIVDFQNAVSAIQNCEKPVIAAMHGIAYGLAVDMATAADVRLCAEDVRFSVREAAIGLAADVGTLARLPHSGVSFSWVKDVCLTAREFGAEEALRVGFVSGVAKDREAVVTKAVQMAEEIAKLSPVAVQGTKEVLNYSREHTVDEGNNYIRVWNGAALQTQDVTDAMLSGIKKTKPKFAKL